MPSRRRKSVLFRDRIKELRRVVASSILVNPKNPYDHPKAQRDYIAGILAEFGVAGALLTYETADGLMLVDGQLREEILGDQVVPVLVTDLTEEEADGLLLHLNPSGAMNALNRQRFDDLAMLAERRKQAPDLLATVRQHYADVKGRQGGGGASEPTEKPPERSLELLAKWGTAVGQVWECGRIRLACGDSRRRDIWDHLLGERRASLMWTDPPYGVDYGGKQKWLNESGGHPGGRLEADIANDTMNADELLAFVVEVFTPLRANRSKPGCPCYVAAPPGPLLKTFLRAMDDSGWTFRWQLIWLKQHFVIGRSDYHFKHENMLYGWKDDGGHYFVDARDRVSVIEANKPAANHMHPTVKPPELIAQMICNSTRPGELVIDPFGGSGSTAVACHQTERAAALCELEPKYLAVQLERMVEECGLKPTLIYELGETEQVEEVAF